MQNWCHVSFITSNLSSHFFLLWFYHRRSSAEEEHEKEPKGISIEACTRHFNKVQNKYKQKEREREAICIIRRSTQKSFTFRFLLLASQTSENFFLRWFQQVEAERLFGQYHSIFMMFVLYDDFFQLSPPHFFFLLLFLIIIVVETENNQEKVEWGTNC